MKNSPNQARFLIAFLALAGVACVLWAITRYTGVGIHPSIADRPLGHPGRSLRIRVLPPLAHAMDFAGMLVGAEIGYDFPCARHTPTGVEFCLSQLIKTIIAPLIFSTLVVGIAGHSNLKQVGRMGIKALLYFEVVTTIALFIGLGAIHLTQAGTDSRRQPMPRTVAPVRNGQP